MHDPLLYGTWALLTTPKTYMYITVDTLDEYRMKINTKKNYMYWLHMKLTSFLKISQIGNFYWCTILHTKCQVLIVQVMLLHFQCYHINVSIYEIDLSICFEKIQENINNCNIRWTSWKIRVGPLSQWLTPELVNFLGVQYIQLHSWNLPK